MKDQPKDRIKDRLLKCVNNDFTRLYTTTLLLMSIILLLTNFKIMVMQTFTKICQTELPEDFPISNQDIIMLIYIKTSVQSITLRALLVG